MRERDGGIPLGDLTMDDDLITGEQWAQRARRHATPVESLWLAVLTEAVCLAAGKRNTLISHRHGQEATEWIASDTNDIGSFRWTCDVLHLDVDWIRRELHAKRPTLRKVVNYLHSAGSIGRKQVA